MSRIPPSLLYLTIYNPTLKPYNKDTDKVDHDEDADEEAHCLYYTAREHAVSRDRMLRHLGLAKALVNFSEMFNAGVPCENVHSQARRMVMFSPEPNFWIHACYEVAKTPRPAPQSKKVQEPKGKGKGKEKGDTPHPAVLYDYHDGSLHDIALRTHLQRGYDEFKLLHGSFSYALSKLGREALELQIERFFTVWAWKWDIEDDDFGTQLGTPLHPLYSKVAPLLDKFASSLPGEVTAFALIPPYVIPLRTQKYPPALVRYILARLPPPATPVPGNKISPPVIPPPTFTTPARPAVAGERKPVPNDPGFAMPLSMPTMPAMPNLNWSIDMKNVKLMNWPGYLTFGKGGSTAKTASSLPSSPSSIPASLAAVVDPPRDTETSDKNVKLNWPGYLMFGKGGSTAKTGTPLPSSSSSSPIPASLAAVVDPPRDIETPDKSMKRRDTLDVDTASLLEAISTESVGSYTRATSPTPSALSKSSQLGESSTQSLTTSGSVSPIDDGVTRAETQSEGVDGPNPDIVESLPLPLLEISPPTSRSFLPPMVIFHHSSGDDALTCRMKRVYRLTEGDCTVVLVAEVEHRLDLKDFVDNIIALIDKIQDAIHASYQLKVQQLPSAVNILQPKDTYIISKDECTTTSPAGFTSHSEHLYNGQELLRSDLDIHEFFSRGQNPQHWHMGRHGLGLDAGGDCVGGEVYMEVARKETTLTDVDNELAGVVRRFVGQTLAAIRGSPSGH